VYAHKQQAQKYTFKEAGTSSKCTPLARIYDNSNDEFHKKTYFLRSLSAVNSSVYHYFRLRVRERDDGSWNHFCSSNTLHDAPTPVRCRRRNAIRDTITNTFVHAFLCLRDTRRALAPRQPRESDGVARRAERVQKQGRNGTRFRFQSTVCHAES